MPRPWMLKTRYYPWNWIVSQVAATEKDPQRQRAEGVGDSGDIFPQIFRQPGMRKFPLCVQPQEAPKWLDLWNTV